MGKLRKNGNNVKVLSASHIKEIIILFLIMHPIFILTWLIAASFDPVCKNVGVSFILLHIMVSLYVYIKRKIAKVWLGFELYIWLSFSIIMIFTATSVILSKSAIAIYPFIGLCIGIYFLSQRFVKTVWYTTFDDNVRSGRYDVQNGAYSVAHAPVQYRFKNKGVNSFVTLIEINSTVIIGIAAAAGVIFAKEAFAKDALGVAAAIGALILPIPIIEKYYNFLWAIKWEQEHNRAVKIAYLD